MKTKYLLFSGLILCSISSFSQNSTKTFAITSDGNKDFMWMNIRQVDIATGDVVKTVFDRTNRSVRLMDATTKKQVADAVNADMPTSTLIAAAAYDKKHDKLFFTPMTIGELRWADLSAGVENAKFYTFKSELLNSANLSDEANHITRMAIGADGNGYALTNDANHLISFTTGKKTIITDMGSLIDNASNQTLSVHNKCSSWGGDIVADAYGKLYLFTASRNVFKIDIDTRIATYIGGVTGLTGSYTINGAAVDNDNKVMISSANTFEGFYKVNIKDLAATSINTNGPVYNASDLANGNLLFEDQVKNTLGAAQLNTPEVLGNSLVSIYPNPVTNNQFKVSFDNSTSAGTYNISVTDVQGRLLTNKEVYIRSASQVEIVQLKSKPAAGLYLIKVTDANKKSIFSDKIMIQ